MSIILVRDDNSVCDTVDFSLRYFYYRAGTEIVSKAARDRVAHYLQSLKQHFSGNLRNTTLFTTKCNPISGRKTTRVVIALIL